MKKEGPVLFTTLEVADQLGITSAMVRKLIRQGQAHPFRQMGGTWVFTADELEHLRTRKRTPGPAKGAGGRPKKEKQS